MATKKEIVEDIRKQYGNLISTKDAGKYLGLCPKTTRIFLAGVPHYDMGRKKCYLAIDIANRLISAEMSKERDDDPLFFQR